MKKVLGVGDVENLPTKESGKHLPYYKFWFRMLRRCYGDDVLHKEHYSDCSVSEDFKSLSKFKAWCEGQKGYKQKGWELDKDILVKGNKVYSPEACCFVLVEINRIFKIYENRKSNLPQGVYLAKNGRSFFARCSIRGDCKSSKWFNTPEEASSAYEEYKREAIILVAEKFKDDLDENVYNALIKY